MPEDRQVYDIIHRLHNPELIVGDPVTKQELQVADKWLEQRSGPERHLQAKIKAKEVELARNRRLLENRSLTRDPAITSNLLREWVQRDEKELKDLRKQLQQLEKEENGSESCGCVIL
jgi:hypothetical protein